MKLLLASVQEHINQISIKEIQELLLSYIPDDPNPLSEVEAKPLHELITTYQTAWPILMMLKKHGANQLVNTLETANYLTLKAIAEITKGTEFEPIVSPFLIETIDELETFDRSRIIKLLNRPDLHDWFSTGLDKFISESTQLFSIQILLKSFTPGSNRNFFIGELDAALSNDRLAISPECLSAIINYYEKFPGCSLTETNTRIHQLIEYFFKHANLDKQIRWIRGLSQSSILKLIEYYLTTGNKKGNSGQILSLLCSEWIIANPEYIKKIRLKLESSFLQYETLFDLATEIIGLSNNGLQDAARKSAVAILLSSPRFVSTCSPDGLKKLIEFYKLYSLTLSMEEFVESAFIKSLGRFSAKIQELFRQIESAHTEHDETSNTWLEHKARLMLYRADESVAALLIKLEQQWTSYTKAMDDTSKLALTSLYQYYCHVWPSVRYDIFIRIICHFYSDSLLAQLPAFEKNIAFNRWTEWLLSNHKKQLTNLSDYKEFCLYDVDGQMVGYLSENNQAFTWNNGQFKLLGTASRQIDFFSEPEKRLGYVREPGLFILDTELTTQTLLFILQAISEWELSKYPEIFNLLLRQSLFDGSIAKIYSLQLASCSQSSLTWLERQITEVLTQSGPFPRQSTKRLFQVLKEEYAFELLGLMKDKPVALELFSSLLNSESKRSSLLLGLYASDVHRFMNHHDPVECLAYCLLNYYKTSWIFDLIQLFNFYSRRNQRPYFFIDALSLLARQSKQEPGKCKRLDAILLKLIKSEQGMHLFLKELKEYEKNRAPGNEAQPEFNHHFNKTHLLATINLVNKTSSYEQSEPYRFLLYLLANNQDALFHPASNGCDRHDLFTANEINKLVEFTNRQLKEPPENPDNQLIGHRILSDLLFRAARKGVISLFYSNNTFNPSIARRAVLTPYFKSLVYKWCLPEEVKKTYQNNQTWTENTRDLAAQFREYPLVLDLVQLSKHIWSKENPKQLPIICVFLLCYQGEKKPLLQLLNDYINYFQNNPTYIHALGKLLSICPEHQFAAAIFEALESAIIRNPRLMDASTYSYLANYFGRQSGPEQENKLNPKLKLLKHWGQNKHYAQVYHACNLMISEGDMNIRLYQRIRNEAKIENQISNIQQGFLFNLITLLMRFWHYGWNPEKNRSHFIKPFDEQSPGPQPLTAPEFIHSSAVNTTSVSSDNHFVEKRSQFFRLLNTIARGPRTYETSNSITGTPQRFFGESTLRTNISEVYTQEHMMPI